MITNAKVGDWLLSDYELHYVKEVDDKGNIVCVSTGHVERHYNSLNQYCFPLTVRNKRISDSFKYWSDKIHRDGKSSLNYPDIHRFLVALWMRACETLDDKDAEVCLNEVGEFARGILQAQATMNSTEVAGVRLFR